MSAIYVHIERADESCYVLLRTSTSPNPERKPPMRVARAELKEVLLMLVDAANALQDEGAAAC